MIRLTQEEKNHYYALMQLLTGVEQKHQPEMIEQYAITARKTAIELGYPCMTSEKQSKDTTRVQPTPSS